MYSSDDVDVFYTTLGVELASVSEIQPVFDRKIISLDDQAAVLNVYGAVLTRLSSLGPKARADIARAWVRLASETKLNSASRHNAVDLLGSIEAGKEMMLRASRDVIDPESGDVTAAMQMLLTMMQKGHDLKELGKQPRDHDPDFDAAIWGHTQISDPIALLHFVTCHYLERYYSLLLPQVGVEYAKEKDALLNAMADVVLLDAGRTFGSALELWSRPRAEGGLGWISAGHSRAFASAIGPTPN